VSVKAYPPDSPGRAQEIPTVNTPGGAGGTIATQDEGISVDAAATTLNFVGAGVTATDAGSNVTTVTIPGGSSSLEVLDEGVSKDAAVTSIDFVGAGVTATNVGHAITVTVPGGSGAPVDAEYVVMSLNGTLTNERRLQATTPIVLTDGGANADATLTHATAGTAGTYGSATAIPVVTTNATGHVTNVTTVSPTIGFAAIDLWGVGEDGAVDFDGTNTFPSFATKSGSTYTLTRTVGATQVNIRSGVTVAAANHNVFANINLDIEATGLLHNNGLSSTSTLGGAFTGASFWQQTGQGWTGAGTTAPSAGSSTTNALGGSGGGGGSSPSGAGAVGGTATVPTAVNGGVQHASSTLAAWMGRCNNASSYSGGGGGGGARGDAGGSGAGGGAGGGCLAVFAKTLTGAGTISCNGGTGGVPAAGSVNAGGGGGGGGGCLWAITTSAVTVTTFNGTGTLSATFGAGSAGKGTGVTGTDGSAGRVFPLRVAS
jgi:hypothetical protein